MATNGTQVTVTTSPTLLAQDSDSLAESQVVIRNTSGSVSVFIGGPDVTTSTGYELRQSTALPPLRGRDPIYGVVAASTVRVDVLELAD